ncbi:hypothetical protein [Actinomadura sp. 6N118]|uniref:hypothetical protein n=1 Tax=Actinomadura sp. 6N118 TaxID=3375151 RepID=UPI0037A0FA57
MRLSSRPARAVLVTAAAATAVIATSTTASAASFSVSARVNKSSCTSQSSPYKWWGGGPSSASAYTYRPRGTVFICFTKYKISDSDRRYDYWAVQIQSNWRFRDGDAKAGARMFQNIKSSIEARGNVYAATPTHKSNRSCNQSFSVGVQAGFFGASVSPKICSGYTVQRSSYSAKYARYTSTKAGGLRRVETVYTQKVPQGRVPKYNLSVGVPRYQFDWNGLYWDVTARISYINRTNF